MAETKPLSPDELERLLADLDAGVYDDQIRTQRAAEQARLPKFEDVKPFDVLAWARLRGIKTPGR